MKIVCLMITESRAPIWGIGLSSFLTQWHADKHLVVVLPFGQKDDYIAAATASGLTQHACWQNVQFVVQAGNTRLRLDAGCGFAFHYLKADLVAIFDDDDWAPPDRLVKTNDINWNSSIPSYCSYTRGWFVNLRTLYGEYIETFPEHLWGGCLTFNKAGLEAADGWAGKPQPGKDRAFMEAIKASGRYREYRLIQITGGRGDPVAFSHGKNLSTWLRKKGTPMGGLMKLWMPLLVWSEVLRCQQLMVDTRTFPPQPEEL